MARGASEDAERRLRDRQHRFYTWHLRDRQAAELGQRIRLEPHLVVRAGRGVVEILCDSRMVGGWLCLDWLRLSRRADAIRLAFDQLAVRHRRHVWFSQGQLLLLQGLVGK